MTTIRTLLLAAILAVLPWGLTSYVSAGCGGRKGCGMTHSQSDPSTPTKAKAGQYTCPMHPEVVSDKPGKCPKCGMTLERVSGQANNDVQSPDSITDQCRQIIEEFTQLQDHFDMMMKLTDVGYLAEAMVKHQEMMAQFADNLARHQKACSAVHGESSGTASTGDVHEGHDH